MVAGIALFVVTLAVVLAIKKQRELSITPAGGVVKQGSILAGKTVSGQIEGEGYEYYYFRGSQHSPPYLEVRANSHRPGAFKVSRETGFDRLFKRWGITQEIATLDREFDDFFYISSNNKEFAGLFFGDRQNRRAVADIYDLGFKEIRLDKNTLKARWSPFRPKGQFDMGVIEAVAQKLIEMCRRMPEVAEPLAETAPTWKKQRFLAFAVPILVGVVGVAALVYGLTKFLPLDSFKLALQTLKFSLPLLAAFTWFSVSRLRGRSSSHRELLGVFFIALLTFPFAGAGLGIFLNGRLDRSQPVEHDMAFLEKHISRSSKSLSYHLVIESWRPGRTSEELSISYGAYTAIVSDETRVKVVTRAGKFQYEWLVSYDFYLPPGKTD